jgi:hypothetical protein
VKRSVLYSALTSSTIVVLTLIVDTGYPDNVTVVLSGHRGVVRASNILGLAGNTMICNHIYNNITPDFSDMRLFI